MRNMRHLCIRGTTLYVELLDHMPDLMSLSLTSVFIYTIEKEEREGRVAY